MSKKQKNLNLYDEFLATAPIDRLQKIAARYELLKMIQAVPGDIVECGVFKGSGLYTIAKLNQILMPHTSRKIIGFDFFETDRKINFKKKEDKKVLDSHDRKFSDRKTILANLASVGIRNLELVAGNVVETTKAYAKKNLGFRIAFLYLDVDNYEGTLGILENLFPLVTPGGLVVFDEYALRGHGESDAVSTYFQGKNPKLHSLPYANTPTAYLVKEKF
ncbi:MAG: hypothetical protein A3H63_02300 [Candidatus Harrisonbacteria bacterium RIFCSPLOWO2_02_FULL_45_10c]|uniref:dTDP-6-deoxy-L-hexose 3-O-methyltransferase n=1 Tax=Candidatus Harrisonbacteria bacterium RIFCSPLOWO2_02_FULL_45_10c TaxID=1798410 RepID=A0A1G1ZRT0_9BACT|nr:MAG: hypothetical protein A3H63_02300 [Candidatus Harrisonbacteria bacterium RIFCSPLOWO2_02_FULL_45_10c]